MKHTKIKLAVVIGSSMLIAFIAIALTFNIIMNWHIEKNAKLAINEWVPMWLENDESEKSSYTASWFWPNDSNEVLSDSAGGFDYYSLDPNEMNIVKWLSENQVETRTIHFAQIGKRLLYITLEYPVGIDADSQYIAAVYVDVTTEKQMVGFVTQIIFIVMLACSLGACWGGILIGKKVEQDQKQQKKTYENVSHELKTPLMVIQGYADGLSSGVVKETKCAAEIIISESNKMALMIDEILSLSRIENRETSFTKESIFMPEFINNCLAPTEALAERKGIKIHTDIVNGTAEADPAHLEKAITNIVLNAMRYADKEIQVRYDGKKLSIRDDGEGISSDELEKVFERFYIGNKGNVGIGLSLTKEIVEHHGWEIYAEHTHDGMQFVIEML